VLVRPNPLNKCHFGVIVREVVESPRGPQSERPRVFCFEGSENHQRRPNDRRLGQLLARSRACGTIRRDAAWRSRRRWSCGSDRGVRRAGETIGRSASPPALAKAAAMASRVTMLRATLGMWSCRRHGSVAVDGDSCGGTCRPRALREERQERSPVASPPVVASVVLAALTVMMWGITSPTRAAVRDKSWTAGWYAKRQGSQGMRIIALTKLSSSWAEKCEKGSPPPAGH